MLKRMAKVLVIFGVIFLVTGCASTKKTITQEQGKTTVTTKKIETRFYVEDRVRQDQEMTGNFGYIGGTPIPEDRSQYKDTRKIYVLEVTKNVDEAVAMQDVQIEPYVPAPSQPLPPAEKMREPRWTKPIVIPDMEIESSGEAYVEEYVIQEGDTLQKISKKFYDTYGKWLKIYEANPDVLKDPNRIKPGLKIQIPMNR